MSDYGKAAMEVLDPVIAAARRALARLESEDVPSSVRRVAAYSGGRLPPPLARRLVTALDSDEWLRSKVADELPEDLSDEPDPATVFIMRPEGWWVPFTAAVEAAAGHRAEAELRKAATTIAKLEKKLVVNKTRGKAKTEQRVGRDDAAAREKATAEKQVRAELEAVRRDAAEAQRALKDVAAQLEAKEQAQADAQRELARMRDRARKIRSGKVRTGSPSERGLTRNPVELAKHLDRLAHLATIARQPESEAAAGGAARPGAAKLPPGISPDSVQAIRWLIERDEPFLLVVDGYNVLYQLDATDFSSGAARQRLNYALNRLRRQARSAPRVIVVYDSSLPGERDVATAGSIEVRFAQEDQLADEEVVAIAQETEGPVFVVSTDREVREASEAAGAAALWSESLVSWIQAAG